MKVRVLAIPLLLVLLPTLALSQTGVAYLSSSINWSQTPDLYFTVSGGPPSMCGSLETDRNGSHLSSPGWICTDSNGNVTKGPWTWAGTPGDQTDTNIHIHWTNGTDTYANSGHIWDKSCPVVNITGAYPGAFVGNATDNQWGAGFDGSWTFIIAHYLDTTTGQYWGGGSSYSSVDTGWYGSASTMPSHFINWTLPTTSVPPANAHITGHSYLWIIDVYDGDHLCFPVAVSSSFVY
jgi:hypothetical protein